MIIYKVVKVEREEEREVGGTSATLRQQSCYRLPYHKDIPTVGNLPLFAFSDLASAEVFVQGKPELVIWEAEAPSSGPAPSCVADAVWDSYISDYWALCPDVGDCTRLCQNAWDYVIPGYHTTDTPPGTVLCPSITLRRRARPLREEE